MDRTRQLGGYFRLWVSSGTDLDGIIGCPERSSQFAKSERPEYSGRTIGSATAAAGTGESPADTCESRDTTTAKCARESASATGGRSGEAANECRRSAADQHPHRAGRWSYQRTGYRAGPVIHDYEECESGTGSGGGQR